MNPTLDKAEIDLEYKLDPIKAAAEYGAQFRNDVDALLTPEVIDRATPPERYELPYDDTKYYVAAIDASGGSSDSFTLAICHREGDTGILDLIREVKPPFSPDAVCADFADCMRRYGVSTAWADRYALGWVEEGFKRHSILIEHSDLDRTSIYASFLPLINSNRVELLDLKRLRSQLLSLERKASRMKEIIDHARGHHDDVANVACLSLVKCVGELTAVDYWNWMASPQGIARHNEIMLKQQLRYGGVVFPTPLTFNN